MAKKKIKKNPFIVEKKEKKEPVKKNYYKYNKKSFGGKGYYRGSYGDIFYEYDKKTKKYNPKNFSAIGGDYVYTKVKLDRYKREKNKKIPKKPFFINVTRDGKTQKAFIIKGAKYDGNKDYLYDEKGNLVDKNEPINDSKNYYVLYNKNNKRKPIPKRNDILSKYTGKNFKDNRLFNVKPVKRLLIYLLKLKNKDANKVWVGKKMFESIKQGIKNDIISVMLGAKVLARYKNHSEVTLKDLATAKYIMGLTDFNIYHFINWHAIDKKSKKTLVKNLINVPKYKYVNAIVNNNNNNNNLN